MNNNCESYLNASRKIADSLCGLRMQSVLVHVVEREANVVYLITEDGGFAIDGALDGEILRIAQLQTTIEVLRGSGMKIIEYPPFGVFLQHRIHEVREIGLPWKGHGWEISFEGLSGKSMIVQSIYAAPKPEGFENCLRLGVAEYQWDIGRYDSSPGLAQRRLHSLF